MTKEEEQRNSTAMRLSGGRKWRLAKVGAVTTCLSFISYGIGVYFALKFHSKIVPFAKFSNFLMVVGMALIAWNVYVIYFRKQ